MPKFDWSKESPGWKMAAWAVMYAPRILCAVAIAVAVILGALKG